MQWNNRSQPTWTDGSSAKRQVPTTQSQSLDWRAPHDGGPESIVIKLTAETLTSNTRQSAVKANDELSQKRTLGNKSGKLTLLPKGLLLALEPATGDETTPYRGTHILEPSAPANQASANDLLPANDSVSSATVTPATFVSNATAPDGRQQLAELLGARMQARQAEALHASNIAPPQLHLNAVSRVTFDDLQPPEQSSIEPTRRLTEENKLNQYFAAPDVAQARPSDFALPNSANEDPYTAPTDPPPSAGGRFDELFNEPAVSEQPGTLDDVQGEVDDDLELELERLGRENMSDIDKDLQEDIDRLKLDDIEVAPFEDDEPPLRRDEDDAAAADVDDESPSCDRIYNERDCCDEDAECQRIADFIRNNTLDKLSLNISPIFAPNEQDAEVALRRQAERLAKAPSRTWENRQGEVLATGHLAGFRYGKIQVLSDSGSITDIPVRELNRDDFCFVNAWWGLPPECQLGDEPLQIRDWTMTTFTWTASAVCHKPLYFEHVELERYGHSAGPFIQPVISTAHFFGNFLILPYNVGLQTPFECIYGLGDYRPGNCAPWLIPAFPLHPRAALFQTGAVFGLIGIFN